MEGGCRAWKGVVVHVGSGACQRRKGCSFERTGARVEKRDAQRVRTYQPPLVIVLAPLKRRLESHVRRHRARWGWRGAARCELRLKRGGKRAPRGQHERDRKQAQHPTARASRKKGQNYHFFLTHRTGNGGLWQVSEAPKYLGGGLKKGQFFFSLGRTKAGPFPRLSPIVQG